MRATALLFFVSLFALAGSANAAVLSFEFSGTVTQVPLDEVFGDISPGDIVRGSYTFDTAAADQAPDDAATGSFTWTAPFNMMAAIGAHGFSASGSLNIGILNSFVDQYTVLAVSGASDLTMALFLQDGTGSTFTDDALLGTAPPLNSFPQRDFRLQALIAGGQVQVDGLLVTLGVQTVPEPPPAGLAVAGLLIIAVAAQTRR